MNIIQDIFNPGFELYSFLTQKSRIKNTNKRLILREVRNNIKRLEHRNTKGVNRNAIIEKLENTGYIKALEQGFLLNKVAPRVKIDDDVISYFPPAKKYKGWNVSQLLSSADEKMTALKELHYFFSDQKEAKINLTSRLNNLYYILILITFLIKKSSH